MAVLTPAHWYGLAPLDYYQHAACTVTGEDARFYDPTPTSYTHGNAVCTVDCLLQNKNAILPLLFMYPGNQTRDCVGNIHTGGGHNGEAITCDVALTQRADNSSYVIIFGLCLPTGFSNIQADNWMNRVHIWDITWSPESMGIGRDFADPTDLYTPSNTSLGIYGGSLYAAKDGRIGYWRSNYTSVLPPIDTINDIINQCTNATDINTQQATIDGCRLTYSNALGTMVGHIGPIQIIPTVTDLKPSMDVGCHYVYDISDTTACRLIDDLCTSGDMRGHWRHALDTMSATEKLNALPNHLCQNLVHHAYSETFWLPSSAPPNALNSVIAGFGRQPQTDQLIGTVEPQSAPAYIYRSCALQKYTALPYSCCANDFADGDGNIIFNPLDTQAPPVDPSLPPGYHRSPLIGYQYDTQTQWYHSCFDSTGVPCDPQFRDIAGDGCGVLMEQHCATNPESSSPASWNPNITDGSNECSRWLGRLLYGPGGSWINFLITVNNNGTLRDRTGSRLTPSILHEITTNFHKVFTMQDIYNTVALQLPLTELAATMEPVIFTLYKSFNLNLYDDSNLVNQCAAYTIGDVVNNPLLRKWCGCMLSPASYGSRYQGVSIACTPTCNSSDVMQYGIPCQGTLCILDDITISLVSSSINGSVSLVQICQSCGQTYTSSTQTIKQTCQCEIGDVTLKAVDSVLGTVSMEEVCGKTGNGGKPATVPKAAAATRVLQSIGKVGQTFPYTVVGILVIVALLAIIAYVISKGSKGNSYTWARGLTVGAFIIGAIILAVIAYAVSVNSI